jgi:hypothetical protein
MARKPTETVKLQLRLSEAVRRRLERAASASHRSMNAEIVHRLEQSLKRDEEPEGVRDAMSEGMLKVIDVAAEVVRQIPPARHSQSLRAIDQAQRPHRPTGGAELMDSIRQLALSPKVSAKLMDSIREVALSPTVSPELMDSIRRLALEVAQGVHRESRGEEPSEQLASKVSKELMDRLRQTSSTEPSEQPATNKREGSR